jgi:AcrR family transcriptional regulator
MATAPTRTRILDAALELFAIHGIAATTAEDIRRRAGASTGSFYHHFSNRAAVAGALLAKLISAYYDDFLTELDRHRDARRGIEAMVHHQLSWVIGHPDAAGLMLAQGMYGFGRDLDVSAAFEPLIRPHDEKFLAHGLAWLTRQVEAGHVRSFDSVDLHIALWFGPALHMSRLWIQTPDRQPDRLRSAGKVLASAAWQSLRAT